MKYVDCNEKWNFTNKDNVWVEANEYTINAVVDLPHDFMLSTPPVSHCPNSCYTGYFMGEAGVYSKIMDFPEDWNSKRVILEVGGATTLSHVVFNNYSIAKNYHGYTAYHADLTGKIKESKNVLRIFVNNSAPLNSRWYTGTGLYRHVRFMIGDFAHISPWGISAQTVSIQKDSACVHIEVSIENHYEYEQHLVLNTTILDSNDTIVASSQNPVVVSSNETFVETQNFHISNAQLWDIDSPYLYKVKCELLSGSTILDDAKTTFGIRTVECIPNKGLLVNGNPIKLKGGCVHSDCGLLGGASYKDAEYRKVRLHKENGFNAIRCAHNPPSEYFLDACDEYGILVIDEVFDCWTIEKISNDYTWYFTENWQRDMKSMLLRDRNHPSIIMWGTGNEITEQNGSSNGYNWSKKLADFIRSIDSTRLVTVAISGIPPQYGDVGYTEFVERVQTNIPDDGLVPWKFGYIRELDTTTPEARDRWNTLSEPYAAPVDAVGYNYTIHFYDQQRHSQRMIYCSESFPISDDQLWNQISTNPNILGIFTWSSMQYLGEAFIGKSCYVSEKSDGNIWAHFPDRIASVGDFDICGFRTPQGVFHNIMWGSNETYIAVRPPKNYGKIEVLGPWSWPEQSDCWTFPEYEHCPIIIEVFSRGDTVKLYLNDECIGEAPAGKTNRYRAWFECKYNLGTLTAVSYIDNIEISRHSISTSGPVNSITCKCETNHLIGNGSSLAYIEIQYVDANNLLVQNAEILTTAQISGAAELIAFGNARPSTQELYTCGKFTSYQGKLMAIVKSKKLSGTAKLTVSGGGLSSSLEITIE